MDLSTLSSMLLHSYTKGIPNGIQSIATENIAQHQWNVLNEDLPLPLAIVKETSLQNNSLWMKEFLQKNGVLMSPHGKTTMCPQLFQRQFKDGAWGITIATLQQLKVCRAFGIERIMMANQLIGKQAIHYVMSELDKDDAFEFYCLVDSIAQVDQIAKIAMNYKRPLNVMVECGYDDGRAGCRDLKSAMNVARKVAEHQDCLSLAGIEAYEGNIHGKTEKETLDLVKRYLNFVIEVAKKVDHEKLFSTSNVILTAGGTAYYDLAIDYLQQASLHEKVTVVTRSGCYLLHDSGYYNNHFKNIVERNEIAAQIEPGMKHAVEVWSYVQSVPEKNLVILNFGKRDASYDVTMPIPLSWYRSREHEKPQALSDQYEILKMDDQHAFLKVPANCDLQVGDMVACGVSHPCTTFDKWQWLAVVNDDYTVIDGLLTFF